MARSPIKFYTRATELLSVCEGEFVSEGDLDVEFHVKSGDYIVMMVESQPDIYIKKSSILTLATIIREFGLEE